MYTKKSQASLEFLTTYGWALAAIALVIGTMIYFSMDLESNAPEQFMLGDASIEHFALYEIEADENINHFFGPAEYSGTFGAISFDFQNLEAETITITENLTITHENEELLVDCNTMNIAPGQSATITCWICKEATSGLICEDFLSQETKNKLETEIKYKIADKTFTKVSSGSIYAQAFDAPASLTGGTGSTPPTWCISLIDPSPFYWDATSSECWVKGMAGESCDNACATNINNGICDSSTNWNDETCTVLPYFFPPQTICSIGPTNIYPGKFDNSLLYYRKATILGSCAAHNSHVERICVCKEGIETGP